MVEVKQATRHPSLLRPRKRVTCSYALPSSSSSLASSRFRCTYSTDRTVAFNAAVARSLPTREWQHSETTTHCLACGGVAAFRLSWLSATTQESVLEWATALHALATSSEGAQTTAGGWKRFKKLTHFAVCASETGGSFLSLRAARPIHYDTVPEQRKQQKCADTETDRSLIVSVLLH